MAANPLPDIEYLRECFDWDAATGVLRWRIRPSKHFSMSKTSKTWNAKFAGREAGSDEGRHRRHLCLDYHLYKVHRIIWKLEYGSDPISEIDHKNIDGTNNASDNLREATSSQNKCNRKFRGNRAGFKGVMPQCGRFLARIKLNGKTECLGTYDTPEEAHAVYCEASKRLHGEFGRTD